MLAVTALLLCSACLTVAAAAPATKEMDILMPGVSPQKEDTYLCTAIKLNDTRYIREFIPQHKSGHAHHIILAGCARPGSKQKVWNCGEMLRSDGVGEGEEAAPQCAEGNRMLYAYAMEAPRLKLPEGVTFGVGPRFGLPYLVVQVHYKKVAAFRKDNKLLDKSGVRLKYQHQASPRLGGIHLSLTDGVAPAHSVSVMETACSYDGSVKLHPFAFRTHTHSHGRVVSGFRVRGSEWTLIGSGNPQLPQMFYQVNNSATIRPGDGIAARCVMENTGNTDVPIGATQKDEMCNFYMMYWIPAADFGQDGSHSCFSAFNQGSANIWDTAPEEAGMISATIPGTDRVFREISQEIDREMNEFDQMFDVSEPAMNDRMSEEDLFDF